MLAYDRNAVICDLAETYGITDYKALPVTTLAVLCCGLPNDSRIKRKVAGIGDIGNEVLLAYIVDILQLIRYQLFAEKNDPKPELMINRLITRKKEKEPDKERDAVVNDILERARLNMEMNDG